MKNKNLSVQSRGETKIFCTEFLYSDPKLTGAITSKNQLLVQSQKWHAPVQSREKSKALSRVITWKCQGEPRIWGVRITGLESASGEKSVRYFCLLSSHALALWLWQWIQWFSREMAGCHSIFPTRQVLMRDQCLTLHLKHSGDVLFRKAH